VRIAKLSADGRYGNRCYDQVAKEMVLNVDTARKLAQFANPENGYTAAELRELCHRCDKHNYDLGRTFLMALLSVPRGAERDEFQTQMITEGWHRVRMQQELLARFGHRRHGGRTPSIVKREGLLAQLNVLCGEWLRWHRRVMGSAEKPEVARSRKEGTSLPKRVLTKFETATQAVKDLRTLLA
jgi:hypothetical protein